jgi:hypothetical protein
MGPAEAADGVQHVALGGHVQSGGRLVEHDQRRAAGEGHRQPDALLLATGQLVRVAAQQVGRSVQVSLPQHLAKAAIGVLDRAAVHPDRLFQLRPDPQPGVQCRGRILGHVSDLCAPHGPQLGAGQPEDVETVDPDLAGADGQAAAGVAE